VTLRRSHRRLAVAVFCPTAVMWSHGASACATCFGRDGGKLAEGMNAGILSLLAVVVCVLGGIASFFIYIIRRERHVAAAPEPVAPFQHELH
jgi:hypothetical protein